jgi:ABC-type transporter Mla subunit MlaD
MLSRALFVRPAELRFFSDLQRLTVESLQPTFQREELTLPEALERAARSSEITSEKFAECVSQLAGTLESTAGATADLGENVIKLAGFASMMGKAGKALERATIALDESFSEEGRLTRVFTNQERSIASLTEAVQAAVNGLNTHSENLGTVQEWLDYIGKLLETDINASGREREKQLIALQSIEPLSKATDVVSSKLTQLSQTVEPLTKTPQLVSAKLSELSHELSSVKRLVTDSDSSLKSTQDTLLREIKAVGAKISAASAQTTPIAPIGLSPAEYGIDRANDDRADTKGPVSPPPGPVREVTSRSNRPPFSLRPNQQPTALEVAGQERPTKEGNGKPTHKSRSVIMSIRSWFQREKPLK